MKIWETDSVDTIISYIVKGYLVTLVSSLRQQRAMDSGYTT
jgi:hypothetical protein